MGISKTWSVPAIRILTLFLFAVMTFAPQNGWADDSLVAGEATSLPSQTVTWTSGTAGTCPWELSSDGTLTIRPGNYNTVDTEGYENAVKKVEFKAEDGEKVVLEHLDLSNTTGSKRGLGLGQFPNLTSIDLSGLDTSRLTNMSYMFYNCKSIASIDLSGFDTSSVERMDYMFCNCTSLASISISELDTQHVNSTVYMFSNCESLTSLDLSGLDTSNATDMSYMFYNCKSLLSLNLSSFNTSNVRRMECIFAGCKSLASLDLTKVNTSNVYDMDGIFARCESLRSLDLNNFNTTNAEYMTSMFANCASLTSLDLSNFDTSSTEYMGYMFSGCDSLASLDLSNFDTSNVKNMEYMFHSCASLSSLDLSKFDTLNVMNMQYMFDGCDSLTSLDLSSFDTPNVTNMRYMFNGCDSLTSLDLSSFDTPNTQETTNMFFDEWDRSQHDCYSKLRTIVISKKVNAHIMAQLPGTWKGPAGATLNHSEFQTQYVPAIMFGTWERVFDISKCSVEFVDNSFWIDSMGNHYSNPWSCIYTGSPIEPAVFAWEDTRLIEGVDYTVTYENNTNAGTATVTVVGIGNASGSKSITFTIEPLDLYGEKLVLANDSVAYNGKVQLPAVKTVGNKTLREGVDYTLSFEYDSSPKTAGMYDVYVTGKGNYSGRSDYATFEIRPKTIPVPKPKTGLVYNGKVQKGVAAGTGYYIMGNKAVDAGTYYAYLEPDSNYSFGNGTEWYADVEWSIAKAPQKISARGCSAVLKAVKSGNARKIAKNTSINLKKKCKASAKTKISYSKANKAGGKLITINKSSGKLTLKKGLKAGTYKVKVKLTAPASKNYKAAKKKIVTVKVTVK